MPAHDLLVQLRELLESAGFTTFRPGPASQILHFEDISLMGQVHVLESAAAIVDSWERLQDEFLRQNASRFLRDATKAWNLYTVLLTAQPADEHMSAGLFKIEEDFRGTRKIARAGVASRDDVSAALAPVLPLQHLLLVRLADAKLRLQDRLSASHPGLSAVASSSGAEAIADALLERE